MDSAIVVTWNVPIHGREKEALDYGVEVNEHWGKLAADGKCSDPEMFFFSDGHGEWMVKGNSDVLLKLFMSPENRRLTTKGSLLLDGFRYDFVRTGPASDAYMLEYAELGQELGIIS